jgi:hypothetical protein
MPAFLVFTIQMSLNPKVSDPPPPAAAARCPLLPCLAARIRVAFSCANRLTLTPTFAAGIVTSAAEFAAHIYLMTRHSDLSRTTSPTRICIQVNATDGSVRLQQASTRVNLSSLGYYLQVSDASFPFEEWQEKVILAALHLSRLALSTACGSHSSPSPTLGAALKHAHLLLYHQPTDCASAARCERWGLDFNRNFTPALQRLRMLRMSGNAKVLLRALAGGVAVLSISRKPVRCNGNSRQQRAIAAWVTRRLTDSYAMQCLLCTHRRGSGGGGPGQPHTVVPMDVARSYDVASDREAGTRHGAGCITALQTCFGGHASFVRFDDADGGVGNGSSGRGAAAAHVNGSGGAAILWRNLLNFCGDFRYSRQLGSLYRLRLFSHRCWDIFSFCFVMWPCLCGDCLKILWDEAKTCDWCGCFAASFEKLLLLLIAAGGASFFFLPFFFLIPTNATGSHSGPSVIQGNCSSPRNRCHISSRCEMLSSDTYSCSCPSWLIGSGYDDDPCICYRSFFPVPDFQREICVTHTSHLTLGWWVAFMYGTNACVLLGLLGLGWYLYTNDNVSISLFRCSIFLLVLSLCMIIPVALVGMGQPQPGSLCGGTLCSQGYSCINNKCALDECAPGLHLDGGICCPPHTHAVAGACIAGEPGDCKGAVTQARCDRGAKCVQLDAGHFGCQCPNFFWDYSSGQPNRDHYACNSNLTCAIERGMVMGYSDSPCRCRTVNGWGNQWIPDYERRVCIDKLLRLEFWDYVTFNWLLGTADILIILGLPCYACNGDHPKVVFSIVAVACALFHGLVFGLGLGPPVKSPCGSSALNFTLCVANQLCVDNVCV